ncbi:MAG: hypothetical protein C0467_20200 [Planctomycetaceae bacterium]|nr:hypothetical protein [Planctomycetaceae bacterium]
MSHVLANEAELYFDRGGPVQRFFNRLALRLGLQLTVRARIVGFLTITWVPLLLFALIERRALCASPKESLLQDFATYVRFFVAVPLLIVAELGVGPRLRGAGLHFLHGGQVRPNDLPAFDDAIGRAAKRRESVWADMLLLAVAVIVPWTATVDTLYGEGLATWRSPVRSDGSGVSLTGLWYNLVAVPVLLYFWFRWLWRLFVWAGFLWSVSRLNLDLVATHPDRAGGLGFLGTAHTSLGIFGFCLSAVLSAEAAFLIVFEKVDIETFKVPYAALLLIVELLFLGPLLMFVPILIRTRLASLRDYGLLVDRYNRSFHEKWLLGKAPADEPLLGSADIQSLADLGNSFRFVEEMRSYPFSMRAILQLAIVTSLPCLPLLLLVMPIGKLLELLTKAVV